jgi:hypothetical protein
MSRKSTPKEPHPDSDCKSDSGPTIITRRKDGEAFAIIRKGLLEDIRLTWQARGVLAYLLSKPDGWKVRRNDLANRGPHGEKFIRAVLVELRETGYAKLDRVTTGGKVREWRWTISDTPEFIPDAVSAHVVKRHSSKNDRYPMRGKNAVHVTDNPGLDRGCRFQFPD